MVLLILRSERHLNTSSIISLIIEMAKTMHNGNAATAAEIGAQSNDSKTTTTRK